MALANADGDYHDRDEADAEDRVNRDQHGLDELAFCYQIYIFVAIVVARQVIS